MALWFKAFLVLAEDLGQLLVLTQWLTVIHNSSFRGSDVLF